MEEPLTISKQAPEQRSMDYALLREEGIKYLQRIAGKIWTDYNSHDPGITILEVLSYAITDLGYRAAYPMQDLLTPDPADPNAKEINNFFTACEILPNCPVTVNDYRKLMIDVEVIDPSDTQCANAGVKNAWIEKANKSEVDIYVNHEESLLTYDPVVSGQEPLALKVLHNVLLEFDECEHFGDLNENKITKDLTITEHLPDPELEGLVIRIDVQFPRWDDTSIDWEDHASIRQAIIDIEVDFINLGDNYTITYEVTPVNDVVLSGTKNSPSGPQPIDGLDEITFKVNEFIYSGPESLITFYQQKIGKINEILAEVKATLHANRNLCEDFLQFNALRIEEILLCADIELALDADVEETQAHIYHEIAKFLSPTVYFYTLEEMLTRCHEENQYDITSINQSDRAFTVAITPDPVPEMDSLITITGSNNNNGTYTVQSVRANKENETLTDILIKENIPSDILTEGEKLYTGALDDTKCTPVEKIFEGPKLKHGFIDDQELELADRKKVIHVSDLIQIIMDVPGVVAVRSIQIANKPQDNEDGSIPSKSVKWCLKLAFDQNYVPRLNTDDSRLTFYKGQLPYKAKQLEVDDLIAELEQQEREQKIRYPYMDIDPPHGTFRDPEDYNSIQNDFPLVYGIGEAGLVPSKSGSKPSKAQARQLKGYLMFFDQLLANYLSQLAHVKDLFSMNAARDEFGDFLVGRTYYTQTLFDAVANVDELYIDKAGHEVALNDIAETTELFGTRRNKFLDHLMARFAEQFTDYALLAYRLSGPKAPLELIEDKLAFLNTYPLISSRRGKAFDYHSPCHLWHVDNVSGLEKRASMLLGIAERKASSLAFSPRFKIQGAEPVVTFVLQNDVPIDVLQSTDNFETEDAARLALEKVVLSGGCKENFQIKTDDSVNYYFELLCDDEVLAESVKKDFTDAEVGGDADQAIDDVVELLKAEFLGNPLSNRHNLACALANYFQYTIAVDMVANPPTYTIDYELYNHPFDFTPNNLLLTGSHTGNGEAKGGADVLSVNTGTSTFTIEGNILENLAVGDVVVIDGSGSNDGTYTVASFALNGDDTDIIVDEAIPADVAPLGSLLYNRVSEPEMFVLAESKVHDVLWKVVSYGVEAQNYSFNPSIAPFTPPYTFRITDLTGNILGESVASDFNNNLADEIANVTSGIVTVSGSTGNDGDYNVTSALADGPSIQVNVDSAAPSAIADGVLQFTESFALKAIDKAGQAFTIVGDFTDRLFTSDTITVQGSASNDGDYTVLNVEFDGADSVITVSQDIPSGDLGGDLFYTKGFSIVGVSGNTFTVKGGADEKAVNEMVEFLQPHFFEHEGMHLIEHILLRPKVNGPLFVPVDETTLDETLAANGDLTFIKQYLIKSADRVTQTFVVAADITTDLSTGMMITVSGSALSNGEYTVSSFALNGSDTEIAVEETLIADITESDAEGELSFSLTQAITAVSSADKRVVINTNVADQLPLSEPIRIEGSENERNDGAYLPLEAIDVAGTTEIILARVEQLVQDRLLTINLDEECECAVEDPYTCIAHVVLPYWPGRFVNTDFRKFAEQTLRLEAPAHVFLNICWISCEHMAEFELKYKTWLLANTKDTIDQATVSQSLEELIEAIEKLRNVYPVGTLHDCDEDENLENSIILNNSALGEI